MSTGVGGIKWGPIVLLVVAGLALGGWWLISSKNGPIKQQSQATAAEAYQAGIAAKNTNDYAVAATKFSDALKLDRTNAEYRKELAIADYNLKKYSAAIEQYQALTNVAGQAAFAWNGLGNVYRDQKDLTKAEEAYRASFAANPAYTVAYSNLANILVDQGKKDAAKLVLVAGLKANPDSTELKAVQSNLGLK